MIPNDGGRVLLAGGDLVAFLGQSSNCSFIFAPSYADLRADQRSPTTQRELFPSVAMDPAVVTGPLSGDLVAFGGIDANSDVAQRPHPTLSRRLSTPLSVRPRHANLERRSQHDGRQARRRGNDASGRQPCGRGNPARRRRRRGRHPAFDLRGHCQHQAGRQSETDYDPQHGLQELPARPAAQRSARRCGPGRDRAGTDATDVLVHRRSMHDADAELSQSVVIGSAQATTTCGTANATNDYSGSHSQGKPGPLGRRRQEASLRAMVPPLLCCRRFRDCGKEADDAVPRMGGIVAPWVRARNIYIRKRAKRSTSVVQTTSSVP